METRLLILNADPVFQDRSLAILDQFDGTENRVVRSMPEAVSILLGENFDGFVVEGCSELAQIGPDSTYELGRKWKIRDTNLWGPQAPLPFIRAGVPIARSARRA